jgi:hypothetical protein
MEREFYGQQNRIWRMIRNQKRETQEYININNTTDKQKLVDYFTSLYAGTTEPLRCIPYDANQVEINETEIVELIHKLKNRKSPVVDSITDEMIKYRGPKLWHETTVLIKQIFKFSNIPVDWKSNITIPIFKKGERRIPENYRGINLLSTYLKFTTAIIAKKLKNIITFEDKQQGFRRGRSCTDAIFVIRQLADMALEFNRPIFFCFIDIEKAFDKICRKHVLNILEHQGVSPGIISLIQDIQTRNYARIKVEGQVEGKIPVNQGIRQGDSLSPLLFNIVINEITKDLRDLRG